MKKIFTFIAIFMIATCLTACSTPDDGVFKPDTNDNSQFEQTDKSDNKKSDTETKKDDSKADDKTSESKPDNKSDNKSDNKKPDSNSNKPADKPSKPNGNTGSNSSANKPSNGSSNSSNSSTSKPSQSTEKPAETKPSQPAHQHTWVDHTATKQVPRTVHHDAVYEDVTIPAVTQTQYRCFGCNQWFNSLEALNAHAFGVQIGAESGDPNKCGSTGTGATREYVITPAHTEHRLVKDAWDETVYDTQTYVDYQECTGCHEHRQK